MIRSRIGLRLALAASLTLPLAAPPATAAAPAVAQASAPPAAAVPPHEATPDAPLLPDYYALALARTGLSDDPRWRALHLGLAPGRAQPAVIVLPVQTQAYAFAPPLRALVGARLDQELQRRHVDASAQTDIVDWRGPFVRRSDDATIAAFAAEHPRATLLTLYLGHDGEGHAFVTLARGSGATARLAHRRLDLPDAEAAALDTLAAALPPLLAELGFGDAQPAPPLAPGRRGGCEAADWELAPPASGAGPVALACHALLVAGLMPDYLEFKFSDFEPSAPDRNAWLARAWVEADALAAERPALRALAVLAAAQLRFPNDAAPGAQASLVSERDPVVGPLARMLSAPEQAARSPANSRSGAIERLLRPALAGLPPFAATTLVERARWRDDFHEVDLCALELAVASLRVPPGCEADATAADTALPRRPATPAQQRLLETWRLAAAWRELYVEGEMRGSVPDLAAAVAAMPPRIASHPATRLVRFLVRAWEPRADGLDAHLARSRARVLDYAQAIATVQDWDPMVARNPAIADLLASERADPPIARALDDLLRLDSVSVGLWGDVRLPVHGPRPSPAFLAAGNYQQAMWRRGVPAAAPVAPVASLPAPAWHAPAPGAPPRPSFDMRRLPRLPAREELLGRLQARPSDMEARVELALVELKQGASVAEARRLIDARPRHQRADDAIQEGTELAQAAYLFYFAGDSDTALAYYRAAAATGTYSEADLIARVRLASIAGDARAALAANHARSERYESEWAAADEAAYLFMLGRRDEAWRLVLPRVQTSSDTGLWRAALVGQRSAGTALAELPAWLVAHRLDGATVGSGIGPFAPAWLRAYAVLDRLPTAADIDALNPRAAAGRPAPPIGGLAVVKAALDGQPLRPPASLDLDLMFTSGDDHALLLPFYAWATWNASGGKDALLDEVRQLPLEAAFPHLLSKAMVLAADGRRDEALRFLVAARWELGRGGGQEGVADALREAPYDFVLASWLMARRTGERAYAEQGLAVARGYQHVVQFMAWPYAAEALLGRDPKARELAACRARKLDPASMMLRESGLHPDLAGATCRKATAW